MSATLRQHAARRLGTARRRVHGARELARLRRLLRAADWDALAEHAALAEQRAIWTPSGVAVLLLGVANGEPTHALKVTTDTGAAATLRRQRATLQQLHALEALGAWRALAPQPLAQLNHGALCATLETALPGRPVADEVAFELDALLAALHPLHAATGRLAAPTLAQLDAWVTAPLALVSAVPTLDTERRAALARTGAWLTDALAQRTRSVGWIHGDYWSRNVLADAAGWVTGIVDWDRAAPDELPAHDVLHAALYARKLRARQPLGAIVSRQLAAPHWSAAERDAIERHAQQPELLDDRAALALYWLRHVVENLRRQPAYARDTRWLRDNVVAVVDTLAGLA